MGSPDCLTVSMVWCGVAGVQAGGCGDIAVGGNTDPACGGGPLILKSARVVSITDGRFQVRARGTHLCMYMYMCFPCLGFVSRCDALAGPDLFLHCIADFRSDGRRRSMAGADRSLPLSLSVLQ